MDEINIESLVNDNQDDGLQVPRKWSEKVISVVDEDFHNSA